VQSARLRRVARISRGEVGVGVTKHESFAVELENFAGLNTRGSRANSSTFALKTIILKSQNCTNGRRRTTKVIGAGHRYIGNSRTPSHRTWQHRTTSENGHEFPGVIRTGPRRIATNNKVERIHANILSRFMAKARFNMRST
jgi:hypothetical protein